jgi:hypothetical protein
LIFVIIWKNCLSTYFDKGLLVIVTRANIHYFYNWNCKIKIVSFIGGGNQSAQRKPQTFEGYHIPRL